MVATELGKEMARRGHEVHIVSYDLPFRLRGEEGVYYHKVVLKEYPLFPHPFLTIDLTASLVELYKKFSIQIIHAHYALPNAISALLAREIVGNKVKVITTLHGTDITIWGKDPSLRPVLRYGLERSNAITAVSHSLKKETMNSLNLARPIEVIYNFVDTRLYKRNPDEDLRAKLAPRGEKIILHVSNFRPVKRVPDLLRAFANLSKEKNDCLLLLVGEGVERVKAETMADELGIRERVMFLGTWIDLVPLFSVADLFVLPSEKESFGLAALEAMACGVPVVATKTGGLPEIVEHGKTGFLVPVGDVRELTSAIWCLLSDEVLHQEMAANSRKKAENFSVEKIIPLYEAVYYRVLH